MAGGSLLALVTELINVGFVVPSAQCEFLFTELQQGILLSIGFLGIVCSSHIWGFLTDTWGRKKALQLALSTGWLCSTLSAFATSYSAILTLRFLTGFWSVIFIPPIIWSLKLIVFRNSVSGIQSSALIYLGEFHGDRTRARAVTFASMCMVLSLVWMALVALAILPLKFEWTILDAYVLRPWRLDMMICSLMLALSFFVCAFLPESAQFLLAIGRRDEAMRSLHFVYEMNFGLPAKVLARELQNTHSISFWHLKFPSKNYPVKAIYTDAQGTNIKEISLRRCGQMIWNQTYPVFMPPLLKNTMIMCYLSFMLFMIAHGMNTWYIYWFIIKASLSKYIVNIFNQVTTDFYGYDQFCGERANNVLYNVIKFGIKINKP